MSRMPFISQLQSILKISNKPTQLMSMAAAQTEYSAEFLENYPTPLSSPPPLISKNIELNRALTASSKSSLFSLSKNDLLFQDEWLIAVNKPQGIYCESLLSAVHVLLGNDQEEQVSMTELHLSNRLDRDTSGVTIITKSHKVAAKLVKAFTDHTVKKTYIASCVGTIPKWRKMVIKSGHGRSRHGAWRVYGVSDVGRTLPGGSYVRDMETSFEVVSVNGLEFDGSENHDSEEVIIVEEKSDVCREGEKVEVVVRAYPRNGRTHQIRLHCQYLGIPIRGDVKYEGVSEWKGITYEGHELHAESLCFKHPVTGEEVLIHAPAPLWARQVPAKVSS